MTILRIKTRNGSFIEITEDAEEIISKYDGIEEIDLSPIRKWKKPILKQLNLSGNQLERIDLSPLENCTFLEALDIRDNKLTSIDLSPLSTCKYLKTIYLNRNNLQTVDLEPLSHCKQLEYLFLDNNQLTTVSLTELLALKKIDLSRNQILQVDLTPLSKSSDLREIHLFNNQLRSIDLSPLKSCTKLGVIDLSENSIPEVDTSPLEYLQSGYLKIWFDGKDIGKGVHETSIEYFCMNEMEFHQQSSNSESVWLDNLGITSIDLEQLKAFKNLERLSIQNNGFEEIDLSILESFPNLQWLRLCGNKLKKLDLSPLSNLKLLTILDLSNNGIKDLDLTPLSGCESLQTLVISGNTLRKDVGIQPLRDCAKLQELYAADCDGLGNEFNMSIFSGQDSLIRLDLSGNNLVEFDIGDIGSKMQLQELRLGSNKFSLFDFEQLRGLSSLIVLDLSNNPLCEIDLSPLSANTQLCILSVKGIPPENIDITPLYYLIDLYDGSKFRLQISSNENSARPVNSSGGSGINDAWFFYGEDDQTLWVPENTIFSLIVDNKKTIIMDEVFKPNPEATTLTTSDDNFEGRKERFPFERITWLGSGSFEAIANKENIVTLEQLWKKLKYMPLRAVYSILGMKELYPLGLDIIEIVKDLSPDMGIREGVSLLYDKCVEHFKHLIEDGRSTKDLDIDELGKTIAIKIVPSILESRKREIETIEFDIKDGKVHTDSLSRTYYGEQIVEELELKYGYTITRYRLKEIKRELAEMGIKLKIPTGVK